MIRRGIFVGVLIVFPLFSVQAGNQSSRVPHDYPVHLLPNSPSSEYKALLAKKSGPHSQEEDRTPEDIALDKILAAGKRNLDLLIFINEHRQTPLAFTQPGSLTGIPITSPRKYSGALVIGQYETFMQSLSPKFRDILTGEASFTAQPPLPEKEYLKRGHDFDRIYQTAARWRLMQPWLTWYADNKKWDIRGYYFLKNQADLENTLKNWNSNSEELRQNLRVWLTGECFNTTASVSTCEQELTVSELDKTMWDFHLKYRSTSEKTYNEFFEIPQTRSDFIWKQSDSALAHLAFKDPGVAKVRDFLALNIEDEWKRLGWQLKLDFEPVADVHVEFVPGVTPHVNGLAGNTIVMDENAPLTEWDVQWTIRHEFGHVLGFPDCYVEFYDPVEAVMITYQIDTDDLMCSRAGKMNLRMFTELQRKYLKD